jgi:hypothetical protein
MNSQGAANFLLSPAAWSYTGSISERLAGDGQHTFLSPIREIITA